MCIRDRVGRDCQNADIELAESELDVGSQRLECLDEIRFVCLLYTSDAADERSSVDLGGRRIIKKKTHLT